MKKLTLFAIERPVMAKCGNGGRTNIADKTARSSDLLLNCFGSAQLKLFENQNQFCIAGIVFV
jgi:hypothetical protein